MLLAAREIRTRVRNEELLLPFFPSCIGPWSNLPITSEKI